jgi:hypothetical protein
MTNYGSEDDDQDLVALYRLIIIQTVSLEQEYL